MVEEGADAELASAPFAVGQFDLFRRYTSPYVFEELDAVAYSRLNSRPYKRRRCE